MMCLRRPFVAKNLRDLADCVVGGHNVPPSERTSGVLKTLLEDDPAKRPNVAAVFPIPLIPEMGSGGPCEGSL